MIVTCSISTNDDAAASAAVSKATSSSDRPIDRKRGMQRLPDQRRIRAAWSDAPTLAYGEARHRRAGAAACLFVPVGKLDREGRGNRHWKFRNHCSQKLIQGLSTFSLIRVAQRQASLPAALPERRPSGEDQWSLLVEIRGRAILISRRTRRNVSATIRRDFQET